MFGIYKQEFYKGKLFMYFFHRRDILPDRLSITPLYKEPYNLYSLEELVYGEYSKPMYEGQEEIGYVIVGIYNYKNFWKRMGEPEILKH